MIDPRYMTMKSWANQMIPFLTQYGNVPVLLNEEDWKGWASQVCSFPQLAAVGAPRPEQFTKWEDWVNSFNGAVKNTVVF